MQLVESRAPRGQPRRTTNNDNDDDDDDEDNDYDVARLLPLHVSVTQLGARAGVSPEPWTVHFSPITTAPLLLLLFTITIL